MLIDQKKRRGKNRVTNLSKGFEEELRRQGYRPGTIWKQRRLLNDLISWLQGQDLAMGDLSMAQVDRFMADRRAAGVRRLKTRKALGPFSTICAVWGWFQWPKPRCWAVLLRRS